MVRRFHVVVILISCMVPLTASAQNTVDAKWFRRTGQPVYVKNLECNFKTASKVRCTAVVENEDPEGIASFGMKWEQLGLNSKVLDSTWSSADFQHKRPSNRPSRELEGHGSVVIEEEMDAREELQRIHLHFVFVERKNGSVIPPEGAESTLFKSILQRRAAEENEN